MKNEDNSILEIDRWLKWLKMAAYVGIGIFAVILITYAIKFRAFYDGFKAISNIPNDWSAFGSLLSGASSLLGAVGTVGVMLLAINQFKIQQKQILEQSKKQAEFESKQLEKWAEEARILKFQLYLSHQKQFEDMLLEFEASSRFRVNKRILYKKIFPKNNSNYVSFESEAGEDGYSFIFELHNKFNTLYQAAFHHDMETYTPENLVLKLNSIVKKLSLFCIESAVIGDLKDINKCNGNTGINIFNLYGTIDNIELLINSLSSFSGLGIFIKPDFDENIISYKLEKYYLGNCDTIHTTPTFNGLKELADLQVEFKKHINKGLFFDLDILHNKSDMKSTLEQWDRAIVQLSTDQHDIENIKKLKKAFSDSYEENSFEDFLSLRRRR
ncbi:hypothetical protein Sbal195_0804 [Shewanella baltica OS195]|uniref:Phage abortive infection protein n=1 Tax=Shewanella baltica (strain OS195) TaxID=399599 RepID=A9L1R6_SHEB9|nr:hypothetical protein [Shewanella baltica]ABX47982.1 hypothetical protein Sbal195_0804 [Shewanella baltica OS195]ADT93011.1 hypothetical protein Sbal678_0827 [Shewanella baltica OS678]